MAYHRMSDAEKADVKAYIAKFLWEKSGGAISATITAGVPRITSAVVKRFPWATQSHVIKVISEAIEEGHLSKISKPGAKMEPTWQMTEKTRILMNSLGTSKEPKQITPPAANPLSSPTTPSAVLPASSKDSPVQEIPDAISSKWMVNTPTNLSDLAYTFAELMMVAAELPEFKKRLDSTEKENLELKSQIQSLNSIIASKEAKIESQGRTIGMMREKITEHSSQNAHNNLSNAGKNAIKNTAETLQMRGAARVLSNLLSLTSSNHTSYHPMVADVLKENGIRSGVTKEQIETIYRLFGRP